MAFEDSTRVQLLANLYKQNPQLFSPDEVNKLAQDSQTYGIPFQRNEEQDGFNLMRTVSQAVEGFVSGFTTIDINSITQDRPRNTSEKIANSLGHLLGFVGWIPAPGLLGKFGADAVAEAVGMEKLGAFIRESPTHIKVPSVPLYAADKIMSGFDRITNGGAALDAVKFFRSGSIGQDILRSGLHLGVASAIGAAPPWQLAVEDRMHGFLSGLEFGAVNKALGNLITTGGKADIGGKLFQGDTPELIKRANQSNAIARGLSSSLFFGIPSTVAGDPLELQIYNYLLNAYFGYGEMSKAKTDALKFSTPFRNGLDRWHLLHPESINGYDKLSPEAQKEMQAQAKLEYGATLGEYSQSTYATAGAFKDTKDMLDSDLANGKISEKQYREYLKDAFITNATDEKIASGVPVTDVQKQISKELVGHFKDAELRQSLMTDLSPDLQSFSPDKLNDTLTNLHTDTQQLYDDNKLPRLYANPFMEVAKQIQTNTKSDTYGQYEQDLIGLAKDNLTDKTEEGYNKFVQAVNNKYPDIKDLDTTLIRRAWVKVSQSVARNVLQATPDGIQRLPSVNLDGSSRPVQLTPRSPMDKIFNDHVGEITTFRGKDNNGKDAEIGIYDAVDSGQTSIQKLIKDNFKNGFAIYGGVKANGNLLSAKLLIDRAGAQPILQAVQASDFKNDFEQGAARSGLDNFTYKHLYANNIEFLRQFNGYDTVEQMFEAKKAGADLIFDPIALNKRLQVFNTHGPVIDPEWMKGTLGGVTPSPIEWGFDGRPTNKGIIKTDKGFIQVTDTSDNIKINESYVEPQDRGKGIGTKIYKSLLDSSTKPVTSDIVVSQDAYRVWKRLQKEGYDIKENPSTARVVKGETLHFAEETTAPVFEFTPKPQKDNSNLRFIILNSENQNKLPRSLKKEAISMAKGKTLLDGGDLYRSDVFDAMLKYGGYSLDNSFIKGVELASGKDDLGGLIVKHGKHRASDELSQWMSDNNIHGIKFDTTVKQRGAREKYDFQYNKGKLTAFKEGTLQKVEPTVYNMPWDGITIDSADHPENIGKPQKIVKGLLTNIRLDNKLGRAAAQEYHDTFVKPALLGDPKEISKFKLDPSDPTIDHTKLGVQYITELASSGKNTPAFKNLVRDVFNFADTDNYMDSTMDGVVSKDTIKMREDLNKTFAPAKKILMNSDLSPSSLQHPGVKDYWRAALDRYIIGHVLSPRVENSYKLTLTPHEFSTFKFNIKPDEFMLGDSMRNKPVTFMGKTTTWEKAYNEYNNEKLAPIKALMEEELNKAIVRVPTSDTSGIRILKFKGFTGIKGYHLLVHPENMVNMDGADTDADSAFIYHLPDKMKEYYKAHKDDQYTGKGKNKVFRDPKSGPLAKEFEVPQDPYYKFDPISSILANKAATQGNELLGPSISFMNRLSALYDTTLGADVTSKGAHSMWTGQWKVSSKELSEMKRVLGNLAADSADGIKLDTREGIQSKILDKVFGKVEHKMYGGEVKELLPSEKLPGILLSGEKFPRRLMDTKFYPNDIKNVDGLPTIFTKMNLPSRAIYKMPDGRYATLDFKYDDNNKLVRGQRVVNYIAQGTKLTDVNPLALGSNHYIKSFSGVDGAIRGHDYTHDRSFTFSEKLNKFKNVPEDVNSVWYNTAREIGDKTNYNPEALNWINVKAVDQFFERMNQEANKGDSLGRQYLRQLIRKKLNTPYQDFQKEVSDYIASAEASGDLNTDKIIDFKDGLKYQDLADWVSYFQQPRYVQAIQKESGRNNGMKIVRNIAEQVDRFKLQDSAIRNKQPIPEDLQQHLDPEITDNIKLDKAVADFKGSLSTQAQKDFFDARMIGSLVSQTQTRKAFIAPAQTEIDAINKKIKQLNSMPQANVWNKNAAVEFPENTTRVSDNRRNSFYFYSPPSSHLFDNLKRNDYISYQGNKFRILNTGETAKGKYIETDFQPVKTPLDGLRQQLGGAENYKDQLSKLWYRTNASSLAARLSSTDPRIIKEYTGIFSKLTNKINTNNLLNENKSFDGPETEKSISEITGEPTMLETDTLLVEPTVQKFFATSDKILAENPNLVPTKEAKEMRRFISDFLYRRPYYIRFFEPSFKYYMATKYGAGLDIRLATDKDLGGFVKELKKLDQRKDGLEFKSSNYLLFPEVIDRKHDIYDDRGSFVQAQVPVIMKGLEKPGFENIRIPMNNMTKLHKALLGMNEALDKANTRVDQELRNESFGKLIAELNRQQDGAGNDLFAIATAARERHLAGLAPIYELEYQKYMKEFNAKYKNKSFSISTEVGGARNLDSLGALKEINEGLNKYFEKAAKIISNKPVEDALDKEFAIPGNTNWIDHEKALSELAQKMISGNLTSLRGNQEQDLTDEIPLNWIKKLSHIEIANSTKFPMDSYVDRGGGLFERLPMEEKQSAYDIEVKDKEGNYNRAATVARRASFLDARMAERRMILDPATGLYYATDEPRYPQLFYRPIANESLQEFSHTYFPHLGQPEEATRKKFVRDIATAEANGDELGANKLRLAMLRRMGESKGVSTDESNSFIKAVSEKTISPEDFDKTGLYEMSRHLKHRDVQDPVPGWQRDLNALEQYKNNIYRNYWHLLGANIGHYTIRDFERRAYVGKNNVGPWSAFMKSFLGDNLGMPSLYPKQWLDDASYKIKGTAYYRLTDEWAVHQMAKLDKNFNVNTLSQEDKNTLARKIAWFSNLEGKWELVSLLATPKASINNIFGGHTNTAINTGWEPFRKAHDLAYLQSLNPGWKSWADVYRDVSLSGGMEAYIRSEAALAQKFSSANMQKFITEFTQKLQKNPEMEDFTMMEIAKKNGVTQSMMDKAGFFMQKSERYIRRKSWIAHYIAARQALEANGFAFDRWDHPWLVEMANRGVTATQFLYNNANRPAFTRTSLGKVLSRFQLWTMNSIKYRMNVYNSAREAGFEKGTREYDRFRRMAGIDMFVWALASLFPASLFNSALPAPYNMMKDFSAFIFGNKKERDQAFFGTLPYPFNVVQAVSPPSSRLLYPMFNVLSTGDLQKFTSYQIYTYFPFGRMARDIGKTLENPTMLMENAVGFPAHKLQQALTKSKKESQTETPKVGNLTGSGILSHIFQ